MMKRYLAPLVLLSALLVSCTPNDKVPFEDGLENYPTLTKVLDNVNKYQVQIIYTQIDRNEHGNALMTDFTLNLDDKRYFYPASTVKLPVAILALEWLEEQKIEGLTAETTILIDSVRPSQIPALVDLSAKDSLPSISHYIKKILLVSDNDAFNRLYELLGLDYINNKLQEKGLVHSVISQRLSFPISPEENRYFNPVKFVDKTGSVFLEIPERHTDVDYFVSDRPQLGKAHFAGDSLIDSPMDFTYKNKFALSDLHEVLKRIVFPTSYPEKERFHLNKEHRDLVLKYMSMLPGESDFPRYELPEYYDGYSKFFKFGADERPIPENFRIFNKTGWSYGYLIDGSYFVDFENGVEFFVSAVVYANENEILNDDTYEFEEIGKPFFAELGDYLYQLELERKKQIPAQLKEFRFEY